MLEIYFCICFFLPYGVFTQFPTPLGNYANSMVLVNDIYKIHWNATATSITAELHVKTKGWLGFGISTNGGMVGSDVIVAWIDNNGHTNFTDRHISASRQVLIDNQQNWFLLGSQKTGNFTIIQFTRLINTCDDQDLVIPTGTARVIVAWNDYLPPAGQDIQYHGAQNRQPVSILFRNSLKQPLVITPADKIESYDFNVNVSYFSINRSVYIICFILH